MTQQTASCFCANVLIDDIIYSHKFLIAFDFVWMSVYKVDHMERHVMSWNRVQKMRRTMKITYHHLFINFNAARTLVST